MDEPVLRAILTAYEVDQMSMSAIAKTFKVPLWQVGYALAMVGLKPTIRRASVTTLTKAYTLRIPKGLQPEIPKSWIGREVKVVLNRTRKTKRSFSPKRRAVKPRG